MVSQINYGFRLNSGLQNQRLYQKRRISRVARDFDQKFEILSWGWKSFKLSSWFFHANPTYTIRILVAIIWSELISCCDCHITLWATTFFELDILELISILNCRFSVFLDFSILYRPEVRPYSLPVCFLEFKNFS